MWTSRLGWSRLPLITGNRGNVDIWARLSLGEAGLGDFCLQGNPGNVDIQARLVEATSDYRTSWECGYLC